MEMGNSCAAHDALLFEYTLCSNEIGLGNCGRGRERRRFDDLLRSTVISRVHGCPMLTCYSFVLKFDGKAVFDQNSSAKSRVWA